MNLLVLSKAIRAGESEAPATIRIRPVQGPAEGRIEIDLNSSETLFQNGQNRNASEFASHAGFSNANSATRPMSTGQCHERGT